MVDDQSELRYRHSTSFQLARLETITRNLCQKRLSGAVFLHMAKDFNTAWIDVLLYKRTLLNFQSYIAHTILSYLTGPTFKGSFQTSTSSHPGMRSEVAQGGLIPHVLFSLYVDMPSPSQQVKLVLYTEDTVSTSRKQTLLVSYLES